MVRKPDFLSGLGHKMTPAPFSSPAHSSTLRYADPDWLVRLANGIRWLLVGLVLAVATVVALRFLPIEVASWGLWPIVITSWGIALTVITIAGVWILTTPHPLEARDRTDAIRRVARCTFIAAEAGRSVIGALTAALGSVTMLEVASAVATLVWFAGNFALLMYLASLAILGNSPSLAWSSNILKWGFTATGLVTVAGDVYVRFVDQTPFPPEGSASFIFGFIAACAVVLAWPVFILWLSILLVRYRRLFLTNAAESKTRIKTSAGGP